MGKELVRTVLLGYALEHTPAQIDLLPAVHSRILASRASANSRRSSQWRGPFAQQAHRSLILAGASLLLMSLGIFSFHVPATEVSAAYVLSRAEQSVTEAPTSGVRSLHGVYHLRYRNNPAGAFSEVRDEIWYQAPGQLVGTRVTHLPNGQEVREWTGHEGTTWYSHNEATANFLLRQPARGAAPFRATNLDDVLEAARRELPTGRPVYTATLVGTETVAKRPAYVVEMVFVPGSSLQTPELQVPTHLKWWIDQQAFFVLREEGSDAAGRLMQAGSFESLEVNTPVDKRVFHFSAPAGANILDLRPVTSSELDKLWGSITAQTSYTVFTLNKTPRGLAAGRPSYDHSRRITWQVYYDEAFAAREESGEKAEPNSPYVVTPRLIIMQGPPAMIMTEKLGPAQSVTINGAEAQLYSQNGSPILVMDRDGTRIKLWFEVGLARQASDLIAAGGSLKPAGSSGR